MVDHTVLSRPQTSEATVVNGIPGGEIFDQKLYVETEVYLSQFWSLGLGFRLVLGFPYVPELNAPDNSPLLRL